jgi:hypothetical protein
MLLLSTVEQVAVDENASKEQTFALKSDTTKSIPKQKT